MSERAAGSAQQAEQRVEELQQLYPLPDAWAIRDTFLQHVRIGALDLYMIGLVAGRHDPTSAAGTVLESALGSAAECAGYPVERAYFELLERVCILIARRATRPLIVRTVAGTELSQRTALRVFPTHANGAEPQQRLSLSNGVAVHTQWQHACATAQHELVERDRVLRAWRGHAAVTYVAPHDEALARALSPHYRVHAVEFGAHTAGHTGLAHRVVGYFLFPQTAAAPLAYGFSAARDLPTALAKAEREALQRLAFLWGEPLPDVAPTPAPTPDFHQEHYLYPAHHARLHAWLEGGHRTESAMNVRVQKRHVTPSYDGELTLYVDLTPETMRDRVAVVKAMSPHARQLRFGSARDPRVHPPHPIV
jgi:hypothetical protein